MDNKVDDWLKAKFPIYWDPKIVPPEAEYKTRIYGDFELAIPKEVKDYETVTKEYRKKNGLCLECGEKGKFINLALVCSKHGVY